MAQQGIIMKRNSTNSPILIPIAVSTHPLSTLALQEEYIIVKAYFASFVCLSIYHLNYSSTNTSRDCLLFSIFYLLSSLLLLGFFFSSPPLLQKIKCYYCTRPPPPSTIYGTQSKQERDWHRNTRASTSVWICVDFIVCVERSEEPKGSDVENF